MVFGEVLPYPPSLLPDISKLRFSIAASYMDSTVLSLCSSLWPLSEDFSKFY